MQAIYAGLCLYVVKTEIGIRTGPLVGQVAQILGIAAIMSTVVVSLTRYVSGPVTIGATIICGTVVWALLSIHAGFVSVGSLRGIALSENRD